MRTEFLAVLIPFGFLCLVVGLFARAFYEVENRRAEKYINFPFIVMSVIAFIIASLALAATAHAAEKEHVYRDRFCEGMSMEVRMSNGTRADCVSGRLAVEVEFQDKWHQALGQAMSYSASTGHAPAIILVCRKKPHRCDVQYQRLEDAAVYWKIPLTVWQCRSSDARLSDCRRSDLGGAR